MVVVVAWLWFVEERAVMRIELAKRAVLMGGDLETG